MKWPKGLLLKLRRITDRNSTLMFAFWPLWFGHKSFRRFIILAFFLLKKISYSSFPVCLFLSLHIPKWGWKKVICTASTICVVMRYEPSNVQRRFFFFFFSFCSVCHIQFRHPDFHSSVLLLHRNKKEKRKREKEKRILHSQRGEWDTFIFLLQLITMHISSVIFFSNTYRWWGEEKRIELSSLWLGSLLYP